MGNACYGIDLSGFSQGRTRVVKAEWEEGGNVIQASVIPTVLAEKHQGKKLANEVKEQFQKDCEPWGDSPIVVVDVPLDLQGLPHVPISNTSSIWQLTQRVIDRVLNARPPFADRIGATVTLWRAICPWAEDEWGKTLFESYPAASLRASGLADRSYKENAREGEAPDEGDRKEGKKVKAVAGWREGGWHVEGTQVGIVHNLATLLNTLRVRPKESHVRCEHDELDALLCALAGLPRMPIKAGNDLEDFVEQEARRLAVELPEAWSLPRGFRLLNVDSENLPWSAILLDKAPAKQDLSDSVLCPGCRTFTFSRGWWGANAHAKRCAGVPNNVDDKYQWFRENYIP